MQILVIDDHALFREGLTLMLPQLGGEIEILEAGSAAEALHQLDRNSKMDLLLVDIGLPDIDGIELIAEIRARCVECPLAVVSASDDLHLVRRALAAGAQGFIPKSTASTTFLEGLRSILRGRTWLPTELATGLRNTARHPPRLTRRQQAILRALSEGASNQEIAERLCISTHTVKFHLSTLFKLLDARNRTECVTRAREQGLLDSSGY